MSTPLPADHPPNPESLDSASRLPLETPSPKSSNQEPTVSPTAGELQAEVDRLVQEMDVLRGWFQTLVSGLMIAILIAVSIASWFAYRLLLQEQATQAESTQAAEVREELLKRVTELEDEATRLDEKTGEFSAEFRGTVQTHTVELDQLRDRLSKMETRQSSLELQGNPETTPPKPSN
ncbi:hypothetical protein PROH_01030 [Prochlorothrix hollandica PCC 9006 = CALU 1027]|uniref:Uncharacterized protein n=1 Tax=Prochlorothrix hollandica PCC 9006 = CALU 1027 TaxID=317619 RepID=A0A0M2PX80_PROHO|nr:hypothetical protein PROH_01030 [Prochlorothrix hollandica PCC 9006 = CALU 1027]